MFKSILIANRGEIAVRVMRTAKRMGLRCIAVYSDADARAMHVEMADEAYRIGPASARDSYLQIDAIIEAARLSGAQAIHPGYGFLSENAEFAEACKKAGVVFVGPAASSIRAMGLKDAAKKLMEEAGVPVVPGYHGKNQDAAFLARETKAIGYPVLIKARAGGGGKGMRLVQSAGEFDAALTSARSEAASSFGDDKVLIEKFITSPRHIEIQVFGDTHGQVVHLFERDCSLQRRHQKVIEEAPAPGMSDELRGAMGAAAVKAAKAVDYVGAGTVEFIVDGSRGLREDGFWFMEMNTRLQVEHPVTEAITGQDLVEWQLRVADGQPLPLGQDGLGITGHAFEARLYAEDAQKDFMPAIGRLYHLHLPGDIADIHAGVRVGDEVTPYYDPMLAKLVVHGGSRVAALNKLRNALGQTRVAGCTTNAAFLLALANHDEFITGGVDTGLIARDLAALTKVAAPSGESVAAAALQSLGLLEPHRGSDPFSSLTGWRAWSSAQAYTRLAWHGESVDVCVTVHGDTSFRIETPDFGLDLKVVRVDGDLVTLELEDRVVTLSVIAHERAITVFQDGATCQFELPDSEAVARESGVADGRITAPLPGLVHALHVGLGDKVKAGDALAVLEAMKMQHSLTAPHDGVVSELLTAAGDRVSEGDLLMVLEGNAAPVSVKAGQESRAKNRGSGGTGSNRSKGKRNG